MVSCTCGSGDVGGKKRGMNEEMDMYVEGERGEVDAGMEDKRLRDEFEYREMQALANIFVTVADERRGVCGAWVNYAQ